MLAFIPTSALVALGSDSIPPILMTIILSASLQLVASLIIMVPQPIAPEEHQPLLTLPGFAANIFHELLPCTGYHRTCYPGDLEKWSSDLMSL
jgi:hypothetical protein